MMLLGPIVLVTSTVKCRFIMFMFLSLFSYVFVCYLLF